METIAFRRWHRYLTLISSIWIIGLEKLDEELFGPASEHVVIARAGLAPNVWFKRE